MDFTREPVIETIITPKEGHRLVVRSSKSSALEEFLVEAVEVISFGSVCFFRSTERPKAFLVPVTDYEILEVRETRLMLKARTHDKTIKIAGGKAKEEPELKEKEKEKPAAEPVAQSSEKTLRDSMTPSQRRRERRRAGRRRRTDEESPVGSSELDEQEIGLNEKVVDAPSSSPKKASTPKESARIPLPPPKQGVAEVSEEVLSAFLKPPSRLISEAIKDYRGDDRYRDVFINPIIPDAPLLVPPKNEKEIAVNSVSEFTSDHPVEESNLGEREEIKADSTESTLFMPLEASKTEEIFSSVQSASLTDENSGETTPSEPESESDRRE